MTIKSFFTPDEQKKILALRADGFSIKRISNELHRSRNNVAMFLNSPEEYRKLMKSLALKNETTPAKTSGDGKKKDATKKLASASNKYSKSASSGLLAMKLTPRELVEYNKVILEHRCVIKFLIKLGESVTSIYAQLKKVYSPLNPDLPAVKYWATQFRQGRQTILNESKRVSKLTKAKNRKGISSPSKSKSKTSIKIVKKNKSKSTKPTAKSASKNAVQNGGSTEAEDEAQDSTKADHEAVITKFTIKLPGMDRLSKTLSQ